MIIKALSKSPWGAGLVNTNVGNDDRLAQHNLQFAAYACNRIIPPYLFPRNFLKRSKLKSNRPDAILITPYQAKPTPSSSFSSSPSSSCSHYVLRSRNSPTQRICVTIHVRQPRQLNVNQRHVHLIEIKYCEDTRPGQQLEVAQRQHADLCELINA
eukprot:1141936-Pelagomonas_calceolata.AAC.1